MNRKLQDYKSVIEPVWCPGCGDYGVLTSVQRALLKPLEETEIDLKVPHDPMSQLEAIQEFRKSGKRKKKIYMVIQLNYIQIKNIIGQGLDISSLHDSTVLHMPLEHYLFWHYSRNIWIIQLISNQNILNY